MDVQRLLGVLKDVEESVGSTPDIRNGPRVVDLDILFDRSRTYYLHGIPDGELQIPHPRMQEREFAIICPYKKKRIPVHVKIFAKNP